MDALYTDISYMCPYISKYSMYITCKNVRMYTCTYIYIQTYIHKYICTLYVGTHRAS